jgi:hypothetical protein
MGKVLTPAAVGEVYRMREQLDEWGEAKWSAAHIATQLGVSEATIWRVLKKRAAYGKKGSSAGQEEARFDAMLNDTLGVGEQSRPDLDRRAEESLARMLGGAKERASPQKPALSPEAQARYEQLRSPLDE